MVLKCGDNKMASDQPVKKKLRRASVETDETDFIHNNGTLHLPPDVNEQDLNAVNRCQLNLSADCVVKSSVIATHVSATHDHEVAVTSSQTLPADGATATNDPGVSFRDCLIRQCLCGVPDEILRQPFQNHTLNELGTIEILQLLSNLQLLFDVYLKQNNSGRICSKIVAICSSFIGNELGLIEQIISLCELRHKHINYMSGKVLASFLIVAKTDVNGEWLDTIVNYLIVDDLYKLYFALDVIKRVVSWKTAEQHILEESTGSPNVPNCVGITYSDAESYDTTYIKGVLIKSVESKWGDLIAKIQYLITHNRSIESQTCILVFLSLWESTISVRANLSVIDTKSFYTHLENFFSMLNTNLPPIIWKQLLSLFNEVLCYGSTLALQDILPEDTCQLAHLVVRHVKNFHLLDNIPFRRPIGYAVNSFVGLVESPQSQTSNVDKTLLQKVTLLVLKSVAITIKETRYDSSDSSVGSEDYDFSQDMQLIARSIRDVLKKVDAFVKSSMEFHPETPFSKILIQLFSDQDDYLIEGMVCALDITTGIYYQNALNPDYVSMLNPVHSFVEFLKVVGHDADVLLDYLVSNETCFLLYLLRFLKYVRRNWDQFVAGCFEGANNELDNTMAVLIRLKINIERLVAKNLFPYNITPVFRLLETCESLYEGNELSSS